MRRAAVFEPWGADGRPAREPISVQEAERVLEYLRLPPIVLSARGFGKDELAPDAPSAVPLTFRTDGQWIWSGAVEYYLQQHALAPEAAFLEHIRRSGYQPAQTTSQQRAAAVARIIGRETSAPAPAPAPPGVSGPAWPIEPAPGDPPLSLLRDKQLVTVEAGAEIDRYGSPEGNFTFQARTPDPHRSLPPEFLRRDYHLYRVLRPIRAIHGVAVPWFEQPGGAAAYVLERTVAELVTEGVLAESVEPDGDG
jgi:hypothetical protein